MAIAASGKDILAVFFDDGAYQTLGCGANGVTCAFGSAQGVPVYAVCQSGAAMTADGARAFAKTLELAAVTGNPVVTFYQSAGAKLEEGQQILRSGDRVGMARLIRALSLQKVRLGAPRKKLHAAEKAILKEAERELNEEFAYVLGLSLEETPAFIRNLIETDEESEEAFAAHLKEKN